MNPEYLFQPSETSASSSSYSRDSSDVSPLSSPPSSKSFDSLEAFIQTNISLVTPPFPQPSKDTTKELPPSLRERARSRSIHIVNPVLPSEDERRAQRYSKAVKKALYVLDNYPKVRPKTLRQKFSEQHQKTLKITRRKAGLSDKTRIFEKEKESFDPIPGLDFDFDRLDNGESELPGSQEENPNPGNSMPELVREKLWESKQLREKLKGIYEDLAPLTCGIGKPTIIKPKPPKRVPSPPFRRTDYPPKTRAEKLLDLKIKLGPKPEIEPDWNKILQPDFLHAFNITPIQQSLSNQKERLEAGRYDGQESREDRRDWEVLCDARTKCKNWLATLPDEDSDD